MTTSRGLMARLAGTDGPLQREIDLRVSPMSAFETATFKLVIMADLAFISSKEALAIEHRVCTNYVCSFFLKA